MHLEDFWGEKSLSIDYCRPQSERLHRGMLLQHSTWCSQASPVHASKRVVLKMRQCSEHGALAMLRGLAGRSDPQTPPRADAQRASRLSRPSPEELHWRQWIRRSSPSSSASSSRTEQRNAWPAELDRRSRARAHPNCSAEGRPHDWVRARPAVRADGHREGMRFRKRGQKSSKDIPRSRQTCCAAEEKGHGE